MSFLKFDQILQPFYIFLQNYDNFVSVYFLNRESKKSHLLVNAS